MATFAEQLIAARKAANMTQEVLANAIHVTRTTISSWERGRTRPDIESLKLLSQTLNWDFMADENGANETAVSPAQGTDSASAVKGKPHKKWLISVICGAAVLALACFLLFILPALKKPAENNRSKNLPPVAAVNLSDMLPQEPETFTAEWFHGGNIRAKNEPWLDIRTQVLLNTDNQTNPFWRYYLTFEEVTGHTFHFDQLDWFCFWAPDRYTHQSFSAASGAVWEDDEGKNWEFIGGDPVQDMEGYGFIIYGHDDAGNKMSFRTFIDMTKAPRV